MLQASRFSDRATGVPRAKGGLAGETDAGGHDPQSGWTLLFFGWTEVPTPTGCTSAGGQRGLRVDEPEHLEALALQRVSHGGGVAHGVEQRRNAVGVGVDANDNGEAALESGKGAGGRAEFMGTGGRGSRAAGRSG
jgi:hypothetical protein